MVTKYPKLTQSKIRSKIVSDNRKHPCVNYTFSFTRQRLQPLVKSVVCRKTRESIFNANFFIWTNDFTVVFVGKPHGKLDEGVQSVTTDKNTVKDDQYYELDPVVKFRVTLK